MKIILMIPINSKLEDIIKNTASGTLKMLTLSKYTDEDRIKINKLIEIEYPKMIKNLIGRSPITIVDSTNKMVQRMIKNITNQRSSYGIL